MNANTPTRVTLYYREGASDKVYQVAIEPAGDRFLVTVAYGRRGSTLTTGTKTAAPVDYTTAKDIYTKLVNGKKTKGYTEGPDGMPYEHTDKQPSSILPQLLNPIEEADVQSLINDDRYCAQEKFDGRHLLFRRRDDYIEGINKKGLVVGAPSAIAADLRSLRDHCIPDGEAVGDHYHVFDLLEHRGEDLRSLPYRERFARLAELLLLSDINLTNVHLVATSFSTQQKNELWERLKRENREGIVFKRLDAPYVSGRPNRGGPQVKFKFVATVSGVVTKINVQRSVEVSLLRGEKLVACGNVTIPANHEIPLAGMIIEVRYLYAYRDSLALYQPVFVGLRDDVTLDECTVAQLKFKAE